jgi:hypothetical protein
MNITQAVRAANLVEKLSALRYDQGVDAYRIELDEQQRDLLVSCLIASGHLEPPRKRGPFYGDPQEPPDVP